MKYTNRGLKQRSENKWEAKFSYTDPVTNEVRRTYYTVEAKTKVGAEKARDALRFELETAGEVASSKVTVK